METSQIVFVNMRDEGGIVADLRCGADLTSRRTRLRQHRRGSSLIRDDVTSRVAREVGILVFDLFATTSASKYITLPADQSLLYHVHLRHRHPETSTAAHSAHPQYQHTCQPLRRCNKRRPRAFRTSHSSTLARAIWPDQTHRGVATVHRPATMTMKTILRTTVMALRCAC